MDDPAHKNQKSKHYILQINGTLRVQVLPPSCEVYALVHRIGPPLVQRSAFHTHVSRASGAVERLCTEQATQDRPNLRKRASKRTGRLSEGASGEMEERLERLQERDGRLSAVVRLVHCITGPRLRRQYFVGTDSAVIVGGGHYLETLQCPMSFVTCVCVCVCSGYAIHSQQTGAICRVCGDCSESFDQPPNINSNNDSSNTQAHLLCSFAFYTSPLYFLYYLLRYGA